MTMMEEEFLLHSIIHWIILHPPTKRHEHSKNQCTIKNSFEKCLVKFIYHLMTLLFGLKDRSAAHIHLNKHHRVKKNEKRFHGKLHNYNNNQK